MCGFGLSLTESAARSRCISSCGKVSPTSRQSGLIFTDRPLGSKLTSPLIVAEIISPFGVTNPRSVGNGIAEIFEPIEIRTEADIRILSASLLWVASIGQDNSFIFVLLSCWTFC